MNGRNHTIIGLIYFTLLWILVPTIHLMEIIMAIFLTICSDVDLKFKDYLSHRSILTHSIILPLLVFMFYPMTITILFVSAFGLHCLCDIKLGKKVGGTYTVKIFRGFGKTIGFNYERSTMWLIGNFIVSLILLIIWCII